jgi:hypothetical protein
MIKLIYTNKQTKLFLLMQNKSNLQQKHLYSTKQQVRNDVIIVYQLLMVPYLQQQIIYIYIIK